MTPADAGAGRPVFVVHLMKTGGFSLLYQVLANVAASAVWGVPDEHADELEGMVQYSSLERLRALDDAARARIQVIIGHLPFVAVDLAGIAEPTVATVVREPVARVVSYLVMRQERSVEHQGWALEQIYEDEFFGARLVRNHQTKMLGMDEEQATVRPPAPEPQVHPGIIEHLFKIGYFDSPQFLADANNARFGTDLIDTPLVWPVPVDDATLARACANLERVDVLGLHEDFDGFLTRLGERTGWTIDTSIRVNTSREVDVAPSFRRRIEEDNVLDLALYDRARELAG